MRSEATTPGLKLVYGTLEDLERAAFLACFSDEAEFEASLARLRAAREAPAPRLFCVRRDEPAT